MKIIFLDIDGVLNCEEAYRNGECKYVEWDNNGKPEHHQAFCSWSKMWLNRLIEQSDAKIVISSTWRHAGIDFMQKVWEIEKMSGTIIGLTPHLGTKEGYTIPRGCEIDLWLKNNGFYRVNWNEDLQDEVVRKSGIENYVIIDDDSDMLFSQRDHFIHVHPSPLNTRGFEYFHYDKAKMILSTNI